MNQGHHEQRVGELQDLLKQHQQRIEELRQERDAERALVAEMRDHVENANAMFEQWIEAFDMVLDDKGKWVWGDGLMQRYEELRGKYLDLLKDWNSFVPTYNAAVVPRIRNFGRPIAASKSQQADVLKRRKAGQSLRDIADHTNLSLRTVRTIVDKADGTDRATLARLQRIAPDKIADGRARSRKRSRDALPRRINDARKHGADLLKRAKGLG